MAEGRFTKALRKALTRTSQAARQAQAAIGRYIDSLIDNEDERKEYKNMFMRHYRKHGQQLQSGRASISDYYRTDPKDPNNDRSFVIRRLSHQHLGRMFMFIYNPKWKDDDKKLPYYDRVPLILLLEVRSNGRILGMNLHYLPPRQRAIIMDALNENEIRNKHRTKQRIRFSYAIMKRASKSNLYKNTIKEYIIAGPHLRSPFLQIPSDQWEDILFMPYDRFVKKDRQYVWRDSMRKARS